MLLLAKFQVLRHVCSKKSFVYIVTMNVWSVLHLL